VDRHLMLVVSNAAPERAADFNAWYEQHVREALDLLPGLVAARRYRRSPQQRATAIPCPWEYLTVYDLEAGDFAALHAAQDELAAAGRLTPHGGTLADGHAVWCYSAAGPELGESEAAAAAKTRLGSGHNVFVALTNPTAGREGDFRRWYEAHVPEVLENYPGLTIGQLFRATADQRSGTAPTWEYLALYDLEADDVADYVANEPTGLETMTPSDGVYQPGPAQWIFTAIGPRLTADAMAARA
jgi:hypothetical protein